MSVHPIVSVALRALRRNTLQTALTVLGMTIGVAAVLTMIALGTGAETAIEDQVRAAGMNLITVTAGNYKPKADDDFGGAVEPSSRREDRDSGRDAESVALQTIDSDSPARTAIWNPRDRDEVRLVLHPEDDPMEKHDHPTARQRLGDSEAGLGSAATLTSADADAIRQVRGVQYVAEGVHQNIHAKAGSKRWFTRLHGTDLQLPLIRRAWTFRSGRFFGAREQARASQVTVLGTIAAEKLFGDTDPVGQDVILWNQPFRVVGVVNTSSWVVAPAPGDDQFDAVYVPFTTMHRLLNLTKLNDITITAASTGDVTRIMKEVSELLRQRHRIGPASPDDFTVTTQARQALAKGGLRPEVARAVVGNVAGLEKVTLEQLGKTLDRASKTMTALLACIAGVSLLVGGIGIMNIMLLSVTERTREIGIRRAVGARARDVRAQFVVEAVMLSVVGGLVGIVLGFGASVGISQYLRWSTTISPAAVALSVGIAAAVGVFFGWYPARQASRLDPIQSLRYE
jgi:putative ABC transport system permease protein